MTTLEEIETALPRLTTPELARLESLAGRLRRLRPMSAATAADLLEWMRQRAATGTLLDQDALDRLDASQDDPRRSSGHWAEAAD